MKVALINDQLNSGGAEKVLVNIAHLLHAQGVDVSVVLYLKPAALDSLINPAIPVHYLHRRGRFDLRAMLLLKKITNAADILHVHSRYNLRYLITAKFFTGIFKPRIVFHEHVPV
jgi:glycosyltransferase involved in cell wall biosynthesis